MNNNRKGIVKDVIIVVVLVVSLLAGAGYFAQRTLVAVRNLNGEQSDPGLDLGSVLKAAQQWADKALPQEKTVPQPAPMPKPSEPATPAAKDNGPKATEQPAAAGKKVELTTVSFFEGDKTAPPAKDRIYTSYFSAQARYIHTQVVMKNNNYQVADANVAIAVEYYDAAGQRMIERKVNGALKKEWNKPSYTTGLGSLEPGYWKPGKYTVKVYFDGQLAGTYGFSVE
jgi:hypothetical protein